MKKWIIAAAGLSLSGAAAATYLYVVRPWSRRWGTTPVEVGRPMPGDEIVPEPDYRATLGVTVEARPEDIWPWLAQLGYKRGGMYSYDWLENLAGLRMTSTDRIIPELQTLKPGDVIPLGPTGPFVPVKAIEVNRSMLLGDYAPGKGGATMCFVLSPSSQGQTRLVVRVRERFNWSLASVVAGGAPGLSALARLSMYVFFEPAQFVMLRKMLLGIKQRAEELAQRRIEESVNAELIWEGMALTREP